MSLDVLKQNVANAIKAKNLTEPTDLIKFDNICFIFHGGHRTEGLYGTYFFTPIDLMPIDPMPRSTITTPIRNKHSNSAEYKIKHNEFFKFLLLFCNNSPNSYKIIK